MSYNSKYTGAEVEALLDKLAIDKEDFFIWSWNGNVYGNLLEGEYDKIKNTTLVLINALGTEAQYMIPVARNIDGDNIVLTIHVSDSEGLVNLTFTFTKEGTWQLVTYEQSFITEEQLNSKQDEITDLDTIRAGAAAGATALQSVPSEYVTESELTNKGYATTSALNGKQDKLTSGTNIKTINGQSLLGSGNITISGGGAVPTKLSQLENDTNFVALQGEELPYIETSGLYDPISGFLYSLPRDEWIGDEDKKLAGVVNIGGFNLVECQGITGSSGDIIVLPREADGYEDDILVTRSYLKTINGQSLIGSGNITISGSGGSSSGGGKEYVEAPIMEEPMGVVIDFNAIALEPNKVYVATACEVTYLNITYVATTDSLCDEYSVLFKAAPDGAMIAFPDEWLVKGDDSVLTGYIEVNIVRTTYQGNDVFKAIVTNFEYE